MSLDIETRLASAFDSYGVERQLHDVPPHAVYEVIVDGRRAVCKVDTGPTGNARVEGAVTAFVEERTSVPVPEVLDVGADYYVAAWHPGAPAPDADGSATKSWASAAGSVLARLHEESARHVETYGVFVPDGEGVVVEGSGDLHAAALDYVRRHRPVLANHGHGDVAAAAIDALVERQNVFRGAGGPVCCHGWATPEHVGVEGGEVVCVLDFEHAIAAPGEFDYWRVAMTAFGPDGGAPERAFREGYESVRPLPAGFERRKPAYVLLNLVYYVESLYVQAQHDAAATAARAGDIRAAVRDAIDALP